MTSRRSFLALAAGVPAIGLLTGCGAAGLGMPAAVLSSRVAFDGERGVGLGFEDVVAEPQRWAQLGEGLVSAHATALSLAVGRPDWTAFPREGHERFEAARVRETGRDFVREALEHITSHFPEGREPRVSLTIDTLVPGWIAKDPEVAGIDPDGNVSDSFACLAALATGPVGDALVELAETVCRRYRPSAVCFTELMFDEHTFGRDDLDHYRVHTGAKDWPRTEDGRIDVASPAVAAWRSRALATLLERVRDVAAAYDVAVEMDVRAPWEDPSGDRSESGHDYGLLLESVHRIVVWNYFALNGRGPEYAGEFTRALAERVPDRFAVSTGLWASNDDVVSPRELAASLRAVAAAGAPAYSVTPASLMTDEHWDVLRELWTPRDER